MEMAPCLRINSIAVLNFFPYSFSGSCTDKGRVTLTVGKLLFGDKDGLGLGWVDRISSCSLDLPLLHHSFFSVYSSFGIFTLHKLKGCGMDFQGRKVTTHYGRFMFCKFLIRDAVLAIIQKKKIRCGSKSLMLSCHDRVVRLKCPSSHCFLGVQIGGP